MDISPIQPTPTSMPTGSAEENLLELSKDMINQIEKLKEALSKQRIDPSLITDSTHLSDFAQNVLALDQISTQAQQMS